MKKKINNNGFTLVELIVVLVILAILAAILIPALLGYIDRSKIQQDVLNARNMMTATQSRLVEIYAKGNYTDLGQALNNQNYEYKKIGKNSADIDLDDRKLAEEIMKVADDEPYAFVFGVQKYGNDQYESQNNHDPFTVYFAIYCATKDSTPIYYDGKEWISDYPWDVNNNADGNNVFEINDKGKKKLQMVIVNNGKTYQNGDTVWNFLKSKHKK